MLELLIIPAILGVGLTLDFISDKIDAYTQEALEDEDPLAENQEPLDLRINGTDQSDQLVGKDGDDTLFGGAGADDVVGGPGDDRIFLGDGNDISAAQSAQDDMGDDFLRGGAGADLISDTSGTNNIFGDLGNDTIITVDRPAEDGSALPATPDTAHGGYGDDTLYGDAGDILSGGIGTDHFILAAGSDDAAAPAVVTDFDAETETLSIVFLDEEPEDLSVNFLHDPEAGTIRAVVGDQEVAILSGLDAEDMPYIAAHVTTLSALMATGPIS